MYEWVYVRYPRSMKRCKHGCIRDFYAGDVLYGLPWDAKGSKYAPMTVGCAKKPALAPDPLLMDPPPTDKPLRDEPLGCCNKLLLLWGQRERGRGRGRDTLIGCVRREREG